MRTPRWIGSVEGKIGVGVRESKKRVKKTTQQRKIISKKYIGRKDV